jgi:hypothetical protein
MENSEIIYHYEFSFRDNTIKEFKVRLDSASLTLVSEKKQDYPDWTKLGFHQCPNCSFNGEDYSCCPIAVNLVDLVDFFREMISYEETEVTITGHERSYFKKTTLQYGVSSLLGIYMVTSGCPVMEKLKPMVRFHLPFASLEETSYRTMSMYLMAQYFLKRRGFEPDWEMTGLIKMFDEISVLNRYFSRRLLSLQSEDASLNALGILGTFTSFTKFVLEEDMLADFERLFRGYFD